MYCEQAETLLPLLALGELDGERRADLEAHLADCASCRARLAGLRATLQLLDEAVNRLPQACLSDERRKALAEAAGSLSTVELHEKGETTLAKVRTTLRKVPPETEADRPPIYRLMPLARKMAQRLSSAENIKKVTPLRVAAAFLICIVLAGLLLPTLSRAREESRRKSPKWMLSQKMSETTNSLNPDSRFFPAPSAAPQKEGGWKNLFGRQEQRLGGSVPAPVARGFRSPSIEDEHGQAPVAAAPAPLFETQKRLGETNILGDRFLARSNGRGPIASAPQSAPAAGRTGDRKSGQNVMYNDGHVQWNELNYASNDKGDRIFAKGADSGVAGGIAVGGTVVLEGAGQDSFRKSDLTADNKDMADYLQKLRARDRVEELGHKKELSGPAVAMDTRAKRGAMLFLVTEKAAIEKAESERTTLSLKSDSAGATQGKPPAIGFAYQDAVSPTQQSEVKTLGHLRRESGKEVAEAGRTVVSAPTVTVTNGVGQKLSLPTLTSSLEDKEHKRGDDRDGYMWDAVVVGPEPQGGPVAALPPPAPGAPPSDGPAAQTAPVQTQIDQAAPAAPITVSELPAPQPRGDEPAPKRPAFKAGPVNPWVMTAQDALSTFGIDVDTASYAIARNYIARGMLPPAASVRMEEYVNAFDYNYPTQSQGVFSVHAEAGPSPFGGPGLTLLKVGVRARVLGREARKPAHLVFVVDASGSMEKPDRMPLVKYALRELTEKLAPQDRISLVTFNTHAMIVLETVPATEQKRIIEAVDGLHCGGSTNLLEGLELGYQLAARAYTAGGINRVILCSDGVANIGATEAEAMLARVESFRRQGVALTAMGVGFGGYDDVLLERLADSGDGNYAYVDTEAEARRVFVEEMAATLQTVAGDAKIQVAFDPARVRRYRLIGFEDRDIADVDFRNDTVDAGEVGSGQSSTALYELELLTPEEGAASSGDLGTVFVRYRDLETGRVEEIANRLGNEIVRPRAVKDSPRFFLATCAAQFAEILRGSEHARNGSLAQVRPIIQSVAAELPLDARVQELAEMVQKADGLPKAE